MSVFTRGLVRSVMVRVLLLPAHFRRRGRHADSLRLRNFYLTKTPEERLRERIRYSSHLKEEEKTLLYLCVREVKCGYKAL